MRSLTSLGETVGALLKARGETVAVSESSTGGLVSAALLAVPGASAYFMGGGVIYTHPARRALLGVRLTDHPGVRSSSEPYAALAAEAMRAKLETTWGLAETGAAGPTGNRYGDGRCRPHLRGGGRTDRAALHPGDRLARSRGQHVGVRRGGAGRTGGGAAGGRLRGGRRC